VALLNSYVNMVFIIPEDEFYEKTKSKRGMHRIRMSRVRRHWISTGNLVFEFKEMTFYEETKGKVTEVECPACGGTGFPEVRQPAQPRRKIYPPPCKRCFGKGRIGLTEFTSR
jgi:DnaJ-class molecular chaperone